MKMLRRWLRRFACAAATLVLVWLLLPRPELNPPGAEFSRVVLDREGRVLFISLTSDGKYRLPAKLAELNPELIAATLEMEDRRYFDHHGADPRSLLRAAWGVATRQRLGGGSTLTMQYARLRWRLDTRSVWGKCVQVFRAVQLERHYGKQELLEAYFTFAPYGGNVESAPAASLLWCGKSPSDLSLRECAALSVLPQSPTARRPRAEGNAKLSAAQARLMARLRAARGEAAQELDAEFSLRPAGVPRFAPHFTRRAVALGASALGRSSLDLVQQETLERSVADFLTRWHSRGLRNAAAILVHAPSREVRAYVGSAGFLNDAINGQVDGVRARRSPGSALKPFIYALAFEEGIIQPHTLLDDTPRRFAGYNPENSDRGFLGPIPAAAALRRSRNVPAVELAARLHGTGLDGFLRSAGVRLARPREEYGLSLALGGAEVSLEELAGLYAMLASDGVARPLRSTLTSAPLAEQAALLSPAARWLTLDALRGEEPSEMVWKTGTSHGFRDAWACGVGGDWVLCVWVGNFDGKPMPGLFARDTAAPLLLQTATRLGLHAHTPPPPPELAAVSLCAESGMLAGSHCPHAARGWLIAGVSPIALCEVHREVLLDASGHRVAHDDGQPGLHREVREFWPAQRLDAFRRAGLPRTEPPPAEGDAALANSGAAPRILSPQPTLAYVLRRGDAEKNSIALEADAAPEVRQIYWFAGVRYLGASPPAQPVLWLPTAGKWTLQAVDDAGRATRVSVTVVAE